MALSDYYETMHFMEKRIVKDPYGGETTVYEKGLEFQAMFQRKKTSEQAVAAQRGFGEVYVIVCDTSHDFNPNDVVQHDGVNYRIITDELKQPMKSTIKTHQYDCEMLKVGV